MHIPENAWCNATIFLKGLDTLGRFPPFLQGRQLLIFPCFFPANESNSENGSNLKGKNLLPGETKYVKRVIFPYTVSIPLNLIKDDIITKMAFMSYANCEGQD